VPQLRALAVAPNSLVAMTISRLREGRIVEDWSAFDGSELLRTLGVWRTICSAPRLLRPLLGEPRRGRYR